MRTCCVDDVRRAELGYRAEFFERIENTCDDVAEYLRLIVEQDWKFAISVIMTLDEYDNGADTSFEMENGRWVTPAPATT